MLECLILGDSIAQGISTVRKECTAIVKSGINSYNWNNRNIVKDLSANTVIISLGTNDPDTINSFKELLSLRQQIYAKKVMWVMPPIKPAVQDIVRIIANSFGDTILTIPELSKDKVHPTYYGYKQLAEMTK
jgi:lysophospholipase L1-like esterase